jgi:hypothetical protein
MSVTIRHLRIQGADADIVNGPNGGGVINHGSLTMIDCTVTRNKAASIGGGLRNNNELTMTGCSVSLNQTLDTVFGGGGIYTEGSLLSLEDCVIEENTTPAGGGGIFVATGAVTLDQDCRVERNTAQSGGGVLNQSGSVELQGSTPGNIVTNNCPDNCAGATPVDHCTGGGSCP